MKTLFALVTLALCIGNAAAQTGIGTATPQALLDIKSSNQSSPANTDGILIPKVDIFPITDPTIAQDGMMVYLTTASGTKPAGFYYWENATTSWKSLNGATGDQGPTGPQGPQGIPGADGINGTNGVDGAVGAIGPQGIPGIDGALNAWGLTGNAGTTAGTNFIGTTDDKNVIFKRNNIEAGRIASTTTSFGLSALNPANTGTSNTAIGTEALYSNTTGINNTANGYQSLFSNTTGYGNTANGSRSLFSNSDGTTNTAYGYQSLFSNSYGSSNTANGYQSLYSNTSGSNNTVNGYHSLYSNTAGDNNAAYGYQSLYLNTTGSNNVAYGDQSLLSNKTGNFNTAIGSGALSNNTTGSNNICIGYNANVPADGRSSNQIRIGNTSILYASIQVAWTTSSDKRWKNTIQTSNLGLDFIKKLHPVSYFRNNDENKKTEYGFIAQELEETLNTSGATNNGIISKDDAGMLSVRYNDLLSPIVKAIQEQQVIIDADKARIKALEEKIKLLEELILKNYK